MAKKDEESELLTAAKALESELGKFEALAEAIRKQPLNSQKNLERAAKSLGEVSDADERLALQARTLVAAIQAVRARQQEQAKDIAVRADELKARTDVFSDLMQRYAGLGHRAAELNASMQSIAQMREQSAPANEVLQKLDELSASLGELADQAHALSTEADGKDFDDVGRQAESLRHQLLSAKNKLTLLQRGLAGVTAVPEQT